MQLEGTPNSIGPYATSNGALEIIADGRIVPMQPVTAWTSGNFNHMPIMEGSTSDELTFLPGIAEYFSGPPQTAMTPAQYAASVSPAVLAEYPLSNYGGNANLAFAKAITDPALCAALHILKLQAAQVPVYGYDFTYQNLPYYFPKMPAFMPRQPTRSTSSFFFPDTMVAIWG